MMKWNPRLPSMAIRFKQNTEKSFRKVRNSSLCTSYFGKIISTQIGIKRKNSCENESSRNDKQIIIIIVCYLFKYFFCEIVMTLKSVIIIFSQIIFILEAHQDSNLSKLQSYIVSLNFLEKLRKFVKL